MLGLALLLLLPLFARAGCDQDDDVTTCPVLA